MAAKKTLPPIPAKYAAMPEPIAREMMASDARNLLNSPAAKKAAAAGTVIPTQAGIGAPQAPLNQPTYVSPADKRRFENQLRIVAERKARMKR